MLFREMDTFAVYYKDGVPKWKVLKDMGGTFYLYEITKDGMEHYTNHKSCNPFSFKKWIMPERFGRNDTNKSKEKNFLPDIVDVMDFVGDSGNSIGGFVKR